MIGYDLSVSINKCVLGSFISPIYNFSLAGNICLHVKSRYKEGKILSQQTTSKVEMPIPVGNEHLSIHFFPHRTRLFHLWSENGRIQSVRDGYQSA